MEDILKGITTCQGATYEYEYIRQFPPLVNDDNMTSLAMKSIKKIIGDKNVFELSEPSMGGEDFAYLAKEVPATFVFLVLQKMKIIQYFIIIQNSNGMIKI
ncbi:M20/M25/M40 family metallo-hydrolase [Terrisporobacter mayombei]|uniref:M20/M25/M40 family metallo-hydrolase n=1 Tax=Terrisporobacter mayombei TaxID=1541 RepID=UPI002659B1BE|nr:M20/M25/M40 family metallo-hydrolase [Terrisporobacter mayombei]MCC3667912.1 M20/M25/M40 family metallo-hydrolase [Terrisporobacter mayombei]